MSASSASVGRGAQSTTGPGTTLRAVLDARRAEGRGFSLEEAIGIIVPLILDVKERHDRGDRIYVHPSAIAPGTDGVARISPRLSLAPHDPRDRACIPPELQTTLAPGQAKSSVFGIGAILYEMLTGASVGPGMPRPSETNSAFAGNLEVLLEKALVADPAHRPDDLGALASALYHVAPAKSTRPPEVDPKNLDHTGEFEVDVRLSLLPPEEMAPAPVVIAPAPRVPMDPFGAPIQAQPASKPKAGAPTVNERLGALKAHLESDPRPRYVVNKDRMDHGPFTAVELLQQIASGLFTGDHGLRDELSGQSKPIKEWEQFLPFAEQTALKREIQAEHKEVERAKKGETRGAVAKSTLAIAVVGVLIAGAAFWFVKVRGSRNDDVDVANDPNAVDLDIDGGVRGKAHHGGGGGGGGHGGGGGGGSYEAAMASNVQQINIGGAQAGPDLTDNQLAGPMRNGTFLGACGTPNSMHVTVKVAIRMGRAAGVSVYTTPPNAGIASCIDHAVRGLAWPANPKMDSFVTTY